MTKTSGEVQFGTNGNDAVGVDRLVAGIIVLSDVIEVYGFGDARYFEEVAGIAREIGIIDQPAQIAFEMADVDSIETNECGEKTPICFEWPIAE